MIRRNINVLLSNKRKSVPFFHLTNYNGVHIFGCTPFLTSSLTEGNQLVTFTTMKEKDVQNVASFIAQLNNIEQSHIGYCGKDSKEIANALREDITDVNYTESFVCAYENNQLIGILGFDADLEDESAEIWGPFVIENKWQIANSLWESMSELLPQNITTIYMFPNYKNKNVRHLAQTLDFHEHSHHAILTAYKKGFLKLPKVDITELTENYYKDMKQLHDNVFPNTYYSGEQIINRLNDNRKVLIITKQNQLLGYIYVEAEPKFGDGSIEFFAVQKTERNKGLGEKLLIIALKWLFTFETIQSVTLTVDSSNIGAIKLYEKVGFNRIHDVSFLLKEN